MGNKTLTPSQAEEVKRKMLAGLLAQGVRVLEI